MVATDGEIGDHVRDSLVRGDDRFRILEQLPLVTVSFVRRGRVKPGILFDRANDRTIGSARSIAWPADRTLLHVSVWLARF